MPIYESRETFFNNLSEAGFSTGALEDRLLSNLVDLGYSSGSLEDRFFSWLEDETASTGSLPDLLRKHYIRSGYTTLEEVLSDDAFLSGAKAFFNGVDFTNFTFTGGPNATLDKDGTLQTPNLNIPAITGGRFVDAATGFVDTDTEGADLYASTPVRGTKLYTDADPEEFKRYLSEPSRTNKTTCVKANPTDTTNITDTGATTTVVDSTTALTAAGLSDICSGNVYNTVLPNASYVVIGGIVGNTNKHSASVWARVVSVDHVDIRINKKNRPTFSSSSFSLVKQEDTTPYNAGKSLLFVNSSGSSATIQFILPQLEEGAFATSIIIGDDSAASQTRTATLLSGSSTGVLRGNNIGIWGQVIPSAAGQGDRMLFATNATSPTRFLTVQDNSSTVRLRKYSTVLLGECAATYANAADTPYQYQAFLSSNYGMGIRVREWTGAAWGSWNAWAINANADDAPIASTYEIGSRSEESHFAGNYGFLRTFWHSDPKTYLESL